MVLHVPIGPSKTRSGLNPVLRCEPSTYQPIGRRLSQFAFWAGSADAIILNCTPLQGLPCPSPPAHAHLMAKLLK